MTIHISDSKITIDGNKPRRKTKDGYLIVDALVARTGLQTYLKSELGLDGEGEMIVYRPESEVFDKKSLRSYSGCPITNDHPSDGVSSKNWKGLAVGITSGDILRDGEHIRVPLVVMDEQTIQDIENGKSEVSMGYSMVIDATAGTTPNGDPYDARATKIISNHTAIVNAGRAGTARLLDSTTPTKQDKAITMTTVKYTTDSGFEIETTAQGAQALTIATKANIALAKKFKDSDTSLQATTQLLDEANAKVTKLEADIVSAKDNAGDIQKAVVERSALLSATETIITAAGKDSATLSNKEIKVIAIQSVDPDFVGTDVSDEAIDVHFGYAKASLKATDTEMTPTYIKPHVADSMDKVRADQQQLTADAWKGKAA